MHTVHGKQCILPFPDGGKMYTRCIPQTRLSNFTDPKHPKKYFCPTRVERNVSLDFEICLYDLGKVIFFQLCYTFIRFL